MLSLRLLTIASLVEKDEMVLDIGTDHAYLPIYLSQNKKCKKIIASDISINALNGAKKNLEIANIKDVKLILSDGLDNIDDKYNCITISGMGTKTILKIINGRPLCNHIILSSNNNLYELRCYMNEIGYRIDKEISILDNNKYYDIISYKLGKETLSKNQLLFGKSNNKNYYKYLLNKEKEIYKKSKDSKKIKKIIYLFFKSI